MAKHILIVDDDALLRRSLAFNLEQAGYRASTAAAAEDALLLARRDPPDLILLDINLPGMDGLDALRTFQQQADTPIIFVSARRREIDQALGLELGADDYITKPFDLNVLLARIKAVLRRVERAASPAPESGLLEVGDMSVDPAAHTVSVAGKPLDLPPREFALLHTLALAAGRVVSTDDLLAHVWGAEYAGESQVVYVHIRWLREKLEEDPQRPRRIITVRGVGYKLEPQVQTSGVSAKRTPEV
ncbi:MAG: response regulator transcription factor [Chloroflexi bacterium]|nr:response regulator transcription factor [Chloroflexota bacterium]